MSGQEINLRALVFNAPGKKEKGYRADEVDDQLDIMQDRIENRINNLTQALYESNQQLAETKADLENAVQANIPAPVTLPEEGVATLPDEGDDSTEAKIGQLNAANEALRRELENITNSRNEIFVQLQAATAQLEAYDNAIEVTPSVTEAGEVTELFKLAEKTAQQYVADAEDYSRNIVENKNAEITHLTIQIQELEQVRNHAIIDVNNYLSNVIEQVNSYNPVPVPEGNQVDETVLPVQSNEPVNTVEPVEHYDYDWSTGESVQEVEANELEASNEPETGSEDGSEFLDMTELGFTEQESDHWDVSDDETESDSIEVLNTDSDSATKRLQEHELDLGAVPLDRNADAQNQEDYIDFDEDDLLDDSAEVQSGSALSEAEQYLNSEIEVDIDLGDFEEDE